MVIVKIGFLSLAPAFSPGINKYNTPLKLISAILKDDALVDDADKYIGDQEHFHLWWLGQSGFLIQWKGERALIDPYLSDSLTKKYADTNKKHIRMSERVVDPELLRNITVVSSSHNHTDHLDAETLIPLIRNNPSLTFIIPEANRVFVAERLNCALDFPIGLNDKKATTAGSFIFHGIPAKHNEIERDEKGNCRFMGYIIEFGRWKIYHSGDTLWFPEMPALLTPFKVDLALFPINGNNPSRGVAGNLDTREAAQLAKSIAAKYVIPCHYDLFTFNTADVNEFVSEAQSIDQPFAVLKLGERWDSGALPYK